jgi:hypothetical protein
MLSGAKTGMAYNRTVSPAFTVVSVMADKRGFSSGLVDWVQRTAKNKAMPQSIEHKGMKDLFFTRRVFSKV